jgi:hypothetical protein
LEEAAGVAAAVTATAAAAEEEEEEEKGDKLASPEVNRAPPKTSAESRAVAAFEKRADTVLSAARGKSTPDMAAALSSAAMSLERVALR